MNRGVVMALGAALAAAASGCVSRVIHELGVCGDGSFAPGDVCFSADGRVERYGVPDLTPISIRGADFTGDEIVDVLVMGSDISGVVAGRTLIGNGDGTLRAPIDAGLWGCSAHPVPGLIDDDSATDLLVDECGDSVSLFLGSPSGFFTGPQSLYVGAQTRSTALVDVSGDGEVEVVTLGTHVDDNAVLSVTALGGSPLVVGAGNIGEPPFDPTGFGIADADTEDAHIVLIDPTVVGGLAIMDHPLHRRLEPARLEIDFTPAGATIGDFDEDGEDEILVAALEEGALVTLEIDEPGTPPVEVGRTEADLDPLARQLTDVDGDGHIDWVTSAADSSDLAIWRGLGNGTFDAPVFVDVGLVPEQFFVADLDGDTAPDLVAANFTAGEIVVLIADP